ncbi:dihydrofolate reductase [Frondihabitans sp. PhB188]|uniref:dihydrofolate reductase family protein n=1 Tax=Frondihabitans sp. PhB188 TaxID=2485200 RepID=UPI000F4781D1|nr:dihydrofolate reductase family protein [Frondihabitans sp. PhB188]ROQ39793.1 dihydrofolate reductase [Frondihabitans sp. PhB188]
MSRIVAVEYVTLDGVFEEPGWSAPYFAEELQAFQYNNLIEADALLLGRVTYEGFSQAWPQMEAETGEFGVKMNSMPKFVATSTPDALTWNASPLATDVVEAVRALKDDASTGTLLINGSAQLLGALVAAGLVDEIRLMVFPVVVGTGRPLWAPGAGPVPLTLAEARTTATGVAILTYTPGALAP